MELALLSKKEMKKNSRYLFEVEQALEQRELINKHKSELRPIEHSPKRQALSIKNALEKLSRKGISIQVALDASTTTDSAYLTIFVCDDAGNDLLYPVNVRVSNHPPVPWKYYEYEVGEYRQAQLDFDKFISKFRERLNREVFNEQGL